MALTPSPAVAFHQHDFLQPPQATVSLSETSLEDRMMTPMTPESLSVKDEDDEPEQEHRKSTKKRKSWGQELPTPKTNLPPRKRAKTEDEKEQRRIERVLRNRAAAQSSRERKRQEVEKLEGEKASIEQQNQYLKDRIMAVEHEKFQLQQQLTKVTAQVKAMSESSSSTSSVTPSPDPEPQVFDHLRIKQEIDDYSLATTPQTIFASPPTMTYSPSQSPTQPRLSFDDDSLSTSPDMTQHPAAMLCDLQCQSGEACQAPSTQPTIPPTSARTVIPSSLENHFAKDTFAVPRLSIEQADFAFGGNDFTFDSMVEFDVDHSSGVGLGLHTSEDFHHFGSNDHLSRPGSSAQNLAESLTQQPSIGASA